MANVKGKVIILHYYESHVLDEKAEAQRNKPVIEW